MSFFSSFKKLLAWLAEDKNNNKHGIYQEHIAILDGVIKIYDSSDLKPTDDSIKYDMVLDAMRKLQDLCPLPDEIMDLQDKSNPNDHILNSLNVEDSCKIN